MTFPSRRSLLAGAAVIAPFAAFGLANGYCALRVAFGRTRVTAQLIAMLHRPSDAARNLGRVYLYTTNGTPTDSLRRLVASALMQDALSKGCPRQFRLALDRAGRDDFASGRTCCVDDWILSQTELDAIVVSTHS